MRAGDSEDRVARGDRTVGLHDVLATRLAGERQSLRDEERVGAERGDVQRERGDLRDD